MARTATTRAYLVIFTLTDGSIQIQNWDQAKYYTTHTPVRDSPLSTHHKVAMKDFHPPCQPEIVIKIFFVDVTLTVDLKSSLSVSTMDYR